MKQFTMNLRNPNNKKEKAEIRVCVRPDRRWNISIIGNLILNDQPEYFEYSTSGKDWEDNNDRLEQYIRHRIKVCVGKDILNKPGCVITNKPAFWKTSGAWLVNLDHKKVINAWA